MSRRKVRTFTENRSVANRTSFRRELVIYKMFQFCGEDKRTWDFLFLCKDELQEQQNQLVKMNGR